MEVAADDEALREAARQSVSAGDFSGAVELVMRLSCPRPDDRMLAARHLTYLKRRGEGMEQLRLAMRDTPAYVASAFADFSELDQVYWRAGNYKHVMLSVRTLAHRSNDEALAALAEPLCDEWTRFARADIAQPELEPELVARTIEFLSTL